MVLVWIDEGEYGYCMMCGDEIEKKWMELDLVWMVVLRAAKLLDVGGWVVMEMSMVKFVVIEVCG